MHSVAPDRRGPAVVRGRIPRGRTAAPQPAAQLRHAIFLSSLAPAAGTIRNSKTASMHLCALAGPSTTPRAPRRHLDDSPLPTDPLSVHHAQILLAILDLCGPARQLRR